MHLTGIRVRELSDFEIDDHQTPQPAMKEKEIDAIPLRADAQPTLPADERKIPTQLQQKIFEMSQENPLPNRFRNTRLLSQEIREPAGLLFPPPE